MKKYSKLVLILSSIMAFQLITVTEVFAFRGGFRDEDRRVDHERTHHRSNHHVDNHRDVNQHDARDTTHRNNEKDDRRSQPNSISEQNALAKVHDEHAPTFSQQHFKMNPHSGIPNNATKSTNNNLDNHNWANSNNANAHPWQNDGSNWNNNHWNNNNWNNNNWNNNWNNWSGSGWGWNSGGALTGAFLGAAVGTALFSPYLHPYSYPYPYSYPSLAVPPLATENYYNYYNTPNTTTVPSPTNTIVPANNDTTAGDSNTNANNTVSSDSNTNTATPTPTKETWVSDENGNLPKNAVVNNTENGKSTYYCRTTYMNKLSYGVLVPQDGCYIETATVTMRFTNYETLVNNE